MNPRELLNECGAGATAVSVLLKREPSGDGVLYAANVGDSRAVLCCKIDG